MVENDLTSSLRIVGQKSSPLMAPYHNLRLLFENKFLVRNLVRRDVRGKYRNALLGYAWTVIEPTLLSIVYWFLFIMLAGNPDEYYAVWVLIGVIVWSCFGKSLMASVTSLTGNTRVIHLVFFHYLLILNILLKRLIHLFPIFFYYFSPIFFVEILNRIIKFRFE